MKKFLSLIIALVTLSALFTFAFPVSAKSVVHKSTINLIGIKKNESGAGYNWDNYESTLTLDGLNLKTDEDFGLKILDGATVVLKGNNYIEAKKAAIFTEGKVVFKGNGTLTLVSDIGIFCSSADSTDSVSILGGTYKITVSSFGIVSDFHLVSFSNCNVSVKTSSDIAIKAQSITTGANTVINANGSISGKEKILIESSSITVNAKDAALLSDKPIVFNNVTLKAGDSPNKLSVIDLEKSSYEGQKSIQVISKYDGQKKSLFFGDSVPRYVDVIVMVLGLAAVVCAVVIPVLYKKKKAAEAIAKRDAAEAESKTKKK